MSGYRTIIVQDDSSSSVATNSSSGSYSTSQESSYTRTSSSLSGRSYLSGITSRAASPSRIVSHSATKPAVVIGDTPNGKEEFVHTGRPQGGNPHGGPKQIQEGYIRTNCPGAIVHNSGGISRDGERVQLGAEFGNGPDHTKECRDSSRWSDNQGLCFCPAGWGECLASTR